MNAQDYDELIADATRYRWLRDNLCNHKLKLPPMLYLDDGDNASYGEPLPETLDDDIDRAMMPPNVKLRGSPASGRVPLERWVRAHFTTEDENEF